MHIYNNILLVYEVQRFCRDFGERYSLDLILDIIQNRLQKNAVLMGINKIEGTCENIYHYVFLLK